MTTAEFNTKLGRSKTMTVDLPDGIAFVNEESSWWDKTFHKSLSFWVRVPRDREAMHFLIVGEAALAKARPSGSYSRRSPTVANPPSLEPNMKPAFRKSKVVARNTAVFVYGATAASRPIP
jgi:hypothetical protein